MRTIKHLPVGDRYDGVNMSTLMAYCGAILLTIAVSPLLQVPENWAVLADGDVARYAVGANPMSWTDLRPTTILSKRLTTAKTNKVLSHRMNVVPNRVSLNRIFPQYPRHLRMLTRSGAADFGSLAHGHNNGFEGIKGVMDALTKKLNGWKFIIDYVVSGELDRFYAT